MSMCLSECAVCDREKEREREKETEKFVIERQKDRVLVYVSNACESAHWRNVKLRAFERRVTC